MLANATSSDVSAAASWQSSNSSVATISSTGLVTTQGFGGADISASYQGTTGKLSVVVLPPPPTVGSISR